MNAIMKINHDVKFMVISEPSQLWKLEDPKLINKANVWQSDDEWEFKKTEDNTMIHIRSINQNKVLEVLANDSVVLVDIVADKADQLWKKGDTMEGYFTLKNSKWSKVLTAISEDKFEVKGILLHILTPKTDRI